MASISQQGSHSAEFQPKRQGDEHDREASTINNSCNEDKPLFLEHRLPLFLGTPITVVTGDNAENHFWGHTPFKKERKLNKNKTSVQLAITCKMNHHLLDR